jgi:hypothetical protein
VWDVVLGEVASVRIARFVMEFCGLVTVLVRMLDSSVAKNIYWTLISVAGT